MSSRKMMCCHRLLFVVPTCITGGWLSRQARWGKTRRPRRRRRLRARARAGVPDCEDPADTMDASPPQPSSGGQPSSKQSGTPKEKSNGDDQASSEVRRGGDGFVYPKKEEPASEVCPPHPPFAGAAKKSGFRRSSSVPLPYCLNALPPLPSFDVHPPGHDRSRTCISREWLGERSTVGAPRDYARERTGYASNSRGVPVESP